MKPRRMLILGKVMGPAQAATGAIDWELALNVEAGGQETRWRVLLATPEVQAEARELATGDTVAFAGWGYGDEAPTMKADGVLVLREASPDLPASEVPALSPFTSRAALDAMLDKVEKLAIIVGVGVERARISAIMNSPDALGATLFAWKVAESGLPVSDALDALRVSKIASAFPPVDDGAALSH